MRNILICSYNDHLLTALGPTSGQADIHLRVCRRGMEAVQDPHVPVVAISSRPVVQSRDIWSDGHSTGIYPFEHLRAVCPCPRCAGAGRSPRERAAAVQHA